MPVFHVDSGEEAYGVKLEMFEGPLDLLLFLIRKNEVDIYDIPIADITKQFLEYVEMIQALNLEQAGDFVLMAATLMKVKSRMLLPSELEEDEPMEDPREELVRRLIEYRQFKEVASWMGESQKAERNVFYRGASSTPEESNSSPEGVDSETYRSVGLFDLLKAYKFALDTAPREVTHNIRRSEVTTEERARVILDALVATGRVALSDLSAGLPRTVIIVTFVAILELIRTGKIRILQAVPEGDVWIFGRDRASA